MFTSATSGNISTPLFGGKLNAQKVETNIEYQINFMQFDMDTNENLTLHLEIEKISLQNLSTGFDELFLTDGNGVAAYTDHIVRKDHTAEIIAKEPYVNFKRSKVRMKDVMKQKLKIMPGFRLTWYYTGMESPLKPSFSNLEFMPTFVRNYEL